MGSEVDQVAGKIIIESLWNNEEFRVATLPREIVQPTFNRFDGGMQYGSHIDDAIVQGIARSDVSVTIALSSPQEFDGGELVITSDYSEHIFKGEAGEAIAYPSGFLHRVEPVTRGCRMAAVTWVQSIVRLTTQRKILFDLASLTKRMFRQSAKSEDIQVLIQTHENLLRMWAEL